MNFSTFLKSNCFKLTSIHNAVHGRSDYKSGFWNECVKLTICKVDIKTIGMLLH